MYTQYKYIIAIIVVALMGVNANAQITIGSLTPPEDFATVQIELVDGKGGGISLPKMTDADKNNTTWKTALAASSNTSAGLVVYNTTSNLLEYWDGSNWVTLSGDISVMNGLSKIVTGNDVKVKLGGNLTAPTTTIAQDNYNFNIQYSTTLGGKFQINAINSAGIVEKETLGVNNGAVSMQPKNALTINSTGFDIKDQNTSIKSTDFKVNINQGSGTTTATKLTVDETTVAFNDLHYRSDVGTNNPTFEHSGYLLTSDNEGNASWAALRPFGAVVTGKLNDNRVNITGSGTDITSQKISLPAGQWLVFGLFNTETGVPTSGANKGVVMYNWVNLNSQPISGGTEKSERIGGTNPESKEAGQLAYATPSFSHYINVKVPTKIWVVAVSSNSGKNQTVSNTETTPNNLSFLGPSYFFAVRLDVAID